MKVIRGVHTRVQVMLAECKPWPKIIQTLSFIPRLRVRYQVNWRVSSPTQKCKTCWSAVLAPFTILWLLVFSWTFENVVATVTMPVSSQRDSLTRKYMTCGIAGMMTKLMTFAISVSELHLTRLCRTEPVAPALLCADLVGAVSRGRVLRLCGYSLTVSWVITHLYTGGASSSKCSILVASIKRSDMIKGSRTDIRTLRGVLLKSVCHARRRIVKWWPGAAPWFSREFWWCQNDVENQSQINAWILDWKDDQALPHDFHMNFRDAQITCKNEVKEIHGLSIWSCRTMPWTETQSTQLWHGQCLVHSTKHKTMTCAQHKI
jgi:hypothetical protein